MKIENCNSRKRELHFHKVSLSKGERGHNVEELKLLKELLGVARGSVLDSQEQLLAEPITNVGVHKDSRDAPTRVSQGSTDFSRIIRLAHHKRAASFEYLKLVDCK